MAQNLDPERARDFCYKIALLYNFTPFSVTSWLRTPKRNLTVGGVTNSAHLFGLAVDVVPDQGTSWAEFGTRARQLGLVVVEETDHLHLQEGGNRYRPTLTI
jgi:hypothetical protein